MQLNIKNGEAYRLAKQLAERTGESLTEAVTKALEERLEREADPKQPKRLEGKALLKVLDDLSRQSAALPVLDDRTADEILGYDNYGLPT